MNANKLGGALVMVVLMGAAHTASAGQIAERRAHQQERIAQGVRSGELAAGETLRLENHEVALNHEVKGMRAANGGTLTAGERQQINGQQNQVSKDIYRLKHNNCKGYR
jgi:hypothetical protein